MCILAALFWLRSDPPHVLARHGLCSGTLSYQEEGKTAASEKKRNPQWPVPGQLEGSGAIDGACRWGCSGVEPTVDLLFPSRRFFFRFNQDILGSNRGEERY